MKAALWRKLAKNSTLGAVFALFSVWEIAFVGFMKRAYIKTEFFLHSGNNLQLRTWEVGYAAAHWPTIEWLGSGHKIIWHLAPLFPPLNLGAGVFSWTFLRDNWLLLCWLIVFYGGIWMLASAYHLFDLMNQVAREKRTNEVRRAMGVAAPGAQATTSTSVQVIQAENILLHEVAESGKWWSLNGVIVGGALAALLAQVLINWLGLNK